MSAHTVETLWMGGMKFNALVEGHTIVMDTPTRVGGTDEGTVPKPLILTALSGCTGMDVIAILRKQNITLSDFEMKAEGELSKTAPMYYTGIHLVFTANSDMAHKEAVLKAISRSQNELCGVAYMLKKATTITWELTFNGIKVADTRKQEIAEPAKM